MSTRPQLWNAEAELDEDLADVDINLALGNYGQPQNVYDVGKSPLEPPSVACLIYNYFLYLLSRSRNSPNSR